MSAFLDLGLSPELVDSLPFELPTAVQAEAIPLILGGGDVCVSAETGSGKTAAFGLSCAQIVHEVKGGRCLVTPNRCLPVFKKSSGISLEENNVFRFTSETPFSVRGSLALGRKSSAAFTVHILQGCGGYLRIGWCSTVVCDSDSWGLSFSCPGPGPGAAFSLVEGSSMANLQSIECRLVKGEILYFSDGIEFARLGLSDSGSGPVFPVISGSHQVKVALDFSNVRIAGEGRGKSMRPYCIVVTPTNPLVDQTVHVLKEFCGHLSSPSVTVVSGADTVGDILVGTPQKVKTLVQTGKVALDQVLFFVLDEADELIKNDKDSILDFINDKIKVNKRVQTLLFSATLKTASIHQAVNKYCNKPIWVDTNIFGEVVPSTVHHAVIWVSVDKEDDMLSDALQEYLDKVHVPKVPSSKAEIISYRTKIRKLELVVELADRLKMDRCMIFCRTNLDCDNMERYLLSLDRGGKGGLDQGGREHRYSCCVLAGFREASEKRRNLELFQQGGIRFLICTDVAARGVDIPSLPFLINLTLPDDSMNYVHRIGRVGRADHMGLALSLVAQHKEKVWFHANCKNRGRDGCQNRATVSEGGCCIWYDEPALFKNIENTINAKILPFYSEPLCTEPLVDNNITRQSRIARKLAALKADQNKVVYGDLRSSTDHTTIAKHSPAVTELMRIESKLQKIYFARNMAISSGISRMKEAFWVI